MQIYLMNESYHFGAEPLEELVYVKLLGKVDLNF